MIEENVKELSSFSIIFEPEFCKILHFQSKLSGHFWTEKFILADDFDNNNLRNDSISILFHVIFFGNDKSFCRVLFMIASSVFASFLVTLCA